MLGNVQQKQTIVMDNYFLITHYINLKRVWQLGLSKMKENILVLTK